MRGVVFALPLPEDVVDPAVVEEEDWVEGGGVDLLGSVICFDWGVD